MAVALRALGVLAAVVGACSVHAAEAPQRRINLLCSVPLAWCEALGASFEKKTGVKVAVTQKEGPEALTLLASQKDAGRFDVWYAGTGEAHQQAADMGLLQEYRSPHLSDLRDWGARQASQAKYRSVGLYMRAMGIIVNTRRLEAKQAPEPRCLSDLARPEYDDEVHMSHPAQSNAGRTTLLALVQIFGEEKAFELTKRIHANVNKYTRRSTNAARAAARGDAMIGVAYMFAIANEVADGFAVRLIVPCEGVPYDVVAMSLIAKSRNPDGAKLFYDWALTPESLAIAYKFGYWHMPAHRDAELQKPVFNTDQAKLIDLDANRFTPAERRRIVDRWSREVAGLPR